VQKSEDLLAISYAIEILMTLQGKKKHGKLLRALTFILELSSRLIAFAISNNLLQKTEDHSSLLDVVHGKTKGETGLIKSDLVFEYEIEP